MTCLAGTRSTGECLATTLPVRDVRRLDQSLPVRDGAGEAHRAAAAAVEVTGPGQLGSLVVVHHKGTYELDREDVREQQAVALARFIEDLAGDRPDLPVIVLGDFNAGPDAASMRFLTGRQSLDGVSVRYEDAWEAVHGTDPGLTFDPANPLVPAGQMPLERGRRLDPIMIRSGPYGPALEVARCDLILNRSVENVWASDHYGILVELIPPPHRPGTWSKRGQLTEPW